MRINMSNYKASIDNILVILMLAVASSCQPSPAQHGPCGTELPSACEVLPEDNICHIDTLDSQWTMNEEVVRATMLGNGACTPILFHACEATPYAVFAIWGGTDQPVDTRFHVGDGAFNAYDRNTLELRSRWVGYLEGFDDTSCGTAFYGDIEALPCLKEVVELINSKRDACLDWGSNSCDGCSCHVDELLHVESPWCEPDD